MSAEPAALPAIHPVTLARASAVLAAGAVAVWAASTRAGGRRRRDPRATRSPRSVLGRPAPAPPAWVARRLARAGCTDDVARLAWVALLGGCAAGGAGLAVLAGPGAAALVVGLVPAVVGLVLVAVGDRASVLVDRELPAVLGAISAGMRSGASLPMAVTEGARRARGPAASDLARVADALAAGQAFADVIERWIRTRPTAGVRLAGAALLLVAETGGAGARTIDGVASTLRDRVAVDRELAALSSQSRASAVVVGLAPIGFVALTAAADPSVWSFFLTTPAGLACLVGGALLDAAGAAWMVAVARGRRGSR